MHAIVVDHLPAIRDLAYRFGVERLEVFGSVCTTEFDEARSDVDFLVTYPDGYDFGPWLGRLQDLEHELSVLLGRDVDVVMTHALRKPRFAAEAAKTRTVIYDAGAVADVA